MHSFSAGRWPKESVVRFPLSHVPKDEDPFFNDLLDLPLALFQCVQVIARLDEFPAKIADCSLKARIPHPGLQEVAGNIGCLP
ncbi:MAG TPA: hypothetical protein VJQ59_12620 [Candidatus Sulfotelmatobacter sp.]|nr:hypothetical protein [Candidatus Sulfotelmatobacter sp.]